MFLRMLLLFLLLPTFAAAGFLTDHVERYVNPDIEPCDDFYDHVCSAAVNDAHFFWKKGAEQMQNVLRQVATPEIRDFRSLVKNNTENFPDEPMLEDDRKKVEKLVGGTIQYCNYDYIKNLVYFDFFDGYEAYDGFFRLKSTPHYNTMRNKMLDIFSVLKSNLIKEFAEAQWTKRHPQLVNFLNNVKLIDYNVKDLRLNEKITTLTQRYEECLGVAANKTSILSKKCIEYATCSDKKILQEIEEFMAFAHTANAQNLRTAIRLSPLFYTLEEEDLPYMLGSLDVAVSHELGHSFFNSKEDSAVPLNSECFREHIYRTCNVYIKNGDCEVYKNSNNSYYSGRFGDDAADWVGIYGGLKALRQYFPKVFSSNFLAQCQPEATKIMKQFFLAYAISFSYSNSQVGGGYHSPAKIRVNGITSLFPEFTEVFQCKRGSNMAKAATCLPFAGAGAPTKKRHQTSP